MNAAGRFLRFVVIGTALISLGWTSFAVLKPDQSARLNTIANRILSGDAYSGSMPTESELKAAEQRRPCNAVEVRGAAIIRLRAYEDAVGQADVKVANERMRALQISVESALACVPTDGFLWFARYWMHVTQGEAASSQLDNLAMSYRLGPNEGWIALVRNTYALAAYELLPDDLRREVRREFASLVNAGFLKQAVHNLKGPGWPLRETLMPELAETRIAMRQYLYRSLRAEGFDIAIPGVERREMLPWR